ncbi:amidase [Acidisoma cellulosilytica]|uniref:Amidase n=1 Tax=Acidisoma cellulosilyticum TaxID=2802395 RepID=A0A963Z313_9PROT|nr:amidase [Acidisoma cellulosilyticum]MCB8880970.1 amidase [Acidisoma cellulosilyticum]
MAQPPLPATPLDDADALCRLSATELVDLYGKGELSPVEVTRATLARAEVVQDRFNAFVRIDHDAALAAATLSETRWRNGNPIGPLDGVPTTIKDIVYVKDSLAQYGSRSPGVTSTVDAPSVALLRQAGAVFLGLTTTPEFGWKALTDGPLTGITRNPWNPDLTPGGSSGGAAVAAATGAGALHIGTDGGGSIRVPAAFTGIVGHKPTFSRVPAYPASAFGTVAHIGPMTRTVADAQLMLQAMSGRDLRDWFQNPLSFSPADGATPTDLNGLVFGVWRTPPSGTVDPEIAEAFDRALARLEAAGVELVPVDLPAEENLLDLFHRHWFAGAAARLSALSEADMANVDPGLRQIAAQGATYSAVDLIKAHGRRAAFGAGFDMLLDGFDAIISPACSVLPFTAGEEVPLGSGLARWTEWAGFSYPVNLAQAPAAIIRSEILPSGLPVGLQIIGPRGEDGDVLSIAAAIESL